MDNVIPLDRRAVRPDECLYCFLNRMLETSGCDHRMRLTQKWIGVQPRSARWVIRWAETQGGYCDCEVILNVFRDDKRSARHRKVRCAASYDGKGAALRQCRGAGS
jgi:hypothetical protein